ncbi:hypothetical protein Enr10x_57080 [Gimesia panareensis]|uniref:Uncharacterized protein n=1 Tax=Gimesia panareensis TaxID=2527978 RepID=A0A517QFC0_9PLAN|nr:hypothetical protein [Gimesia panareensis]QDT30342.1 hypothetical protein Enr10x_57080 [Gimesia panareensis]
MQIAPAIIESLDAIPWLKAGGKESSISTEKHLRQVQTWEEADEAYNEEWETIKELQQNSIARTLATQYREQFNQWNDLIVVVRQEVSQRVTPAITETIGAIGLNPFYANAVCRDIQLYVMEMTYAQYGCVVPIFFRNLFTVYNLGHFPCGWGGGSFPDGFLLYY